MEKYGKIRAYRISRDVSWADFAKEIGLGTAHIQHICSGRIKAGTRAKCKIMKYYQAHRAEIERAAQLLEGVCDD